MSYKGHEYFAEFDGNQSVDNGKLGRKLAKGGGGGGSQTSTSYSTNLPSYAKPYYTELMKQTGMQVYNTVDPSMVGQINPNTGKAYTDKDIGRVTGVKEYTPYEGERVADFTEEQKRIQGEVAGMTRPEQFDAATAGLGTGQAMGFGAAAQGLDQAFAYDPTKTTAERVNSQTFGSDAASMYMNPYQQNVTDTALREARRQADILKNRGMAGSISRGTFGGARQALLQGEQERGVQQNLSDIQYRGMADAYSNAQKMFEADQARRQAAEIANQGAGLKASELTQQGQQFAAGLGKDIGLAGLNIGTDASKAMGALGATIQDADINRLKAQAASAGEIRTAEQQKLDQEYQAWQEAQNYQKNQLEYLSNILRGNAGALGSTQVQYTPAPSLASQVGGLGLAGLGLYNAMK
jgi:hypothetical protein